MKVRRTFEPSSPMPQDHSGTKTRKKTVLARRFVIKTGYSPFILLFAVADALCCCKSELHDETVLTSIGLQGKKVQALTIDPNHPSILYAGTQVYGVYKSVDTGTTWSQYTSGMSDSNVVSLVVDPNVTTILYAGTTSGVFKTFNKGDNWSSAGSGLPGDEVQALVINPSNSQQLYAGMYSTGVYKSTNGGTVWTAANAGLDNLRIGTLCIDPVLTSTLYTGTDQQAPIDGTVYKSTDSGASWTEKPSITGPTILTIALDPNDHNTVFVGSFGGGATLSYDGGATWVAGAKDVTLNVYDFAIDPVSSIVYADTSNGVMKLTVDKFSWN